MDHLLRQGRPEFRRSTHASRKAEVESVKQEGAGWVDQSEEQVGWLRIPSENWMRSRRDWIAKKPPSSSHLPASFAIHSMDPGEDHSESS